jgi:opine dehydrogenase
MTKPTIAIIGAGNGGQAAAGDLALKGFPVRLHDIDSSLMTLISERKGVELTGVMDGFGPISRATADLSEAIGQADLIMITTARPAHNAIASSLAPLVKDGQPILLNPGSSGGALEFAKIFRRQGKNPLISTTATLPYAARVQEPGRVMVTLKVKTLFFATFPGEKTLQEAERWGALYPNLEPVSNVLEVGLNNGNPITHPAPILLNAARIENTHGDFLFYREGTSASVVKINECLDKERLNICQALGFSLIPATERLYRLGYADRLYPTLLEAYQHSEAFAPIKAPDTLMHRYIFEDIPFGLVFFASLGKLIGVSTPTTETVINLANVMTGQDFWEDGLTFAKLGMNSLGKDEMQNFLYTGKSEKVTWSL